MFSDDEGIASGSDDDIAWDDEEFEDVSRADLTIKTQPPPLLPAPIVPTCHPQSSPHSSSWTVFLASGSLVKVMKLAG